MKSVRARFLVGGAIAMAGSIVTAEWLHGVLQQSGVPQRWSLLLTLFAVVAVLLVPLALLLQRAVLRPLGWLLESEEKVRNGRLESAAIPEEHLGSDELGELLRAHNDTLQLLLEQQHELESRLRDQKEKETTLTKVNRALRMLLRLNQTFMSAATEQDLLDAVCRVAVEEGGYRLAWVGYAKNDAAKSVVPMAHAGFEAGYLETISCSWDEHNENGRGPTGTAIRTGEPCVVRNILIDPDYTPWSEEALRRGYAASLALPLTDRKAVWGTLNLYAGEPEAFGDEEVGLLSELTDRLAHEIATLRALSGSGCRGAEGEPETEREKPGAGAV